VAEPFPVAFTVNVADPVPEQICAVVGCVVETESSLRLPIVFVKVGPPFEVLKVEYVPEPLIVNARQVGDHADNAHFKTPSAGAASAGRIMLMFGCAQLNGILLVSLKRTIRFGPVACENVVREPPGAPAQVPAALEGADMHVTVPFHCGAPAE